MSGLPKRRRGRQSAASATAYDAQVAEFCGALLEIDSTLDFKVASRGWCYILEEKIGLMKGDFDAGQRLINDLRKDGRLPLDICAEDQARCADHLEAIDRCGPAAEAQAIFRGIEDAHRYYTPFSFWSDLDVYIEMAVEKVDLKSLFSSTCRTYHVPLTNMRGWNGISSRAAMIERFAKWEQAGKRPILLYCGDFDPGGLNISGFLRSNLGRPFRRHRMESRRAHHRPLRPNYDFIEGSAFRGSTISKPEAAGGSTTLITQITTRRTCKPIWSNSEPGRSKQTRSLPVPMQVVISVARPSALCPGGCHPAI